MSFLTNRSRESMPPAAGMQQAGGAPAPPDFNPQIMRSIRMHPRLAAGVAAVVFGLLAGYGLTRRPVYTAESRVYEEPAAPKLMGDGLPGAFDANQYDSYLQQQMQVVVRPDVLSAALATLPAATWRELGPNEQAAAASLAGQLKVARVTTSYQLSISLQSGDPAAAAAIVNAVSNAYLDTVRKETSAATDLRAQLLGEERRRIEGELETTRREQAGLSASLGVASPLGESGNPYDFELASVRQQLLTARQAHDVSAAQLGALSGDGAVRNTALAAAADELIGADAGLSSMRATIAARRANLNGQMAGMKPDNPVYKQDVDELADLDKTLDTMTTQLRGKAERQLQEKLRTDLERTGDVEARLNAQLAQLTAKATSAAPKLQRASELATDLTRLNTRYAAVDDALRSLQLEANGPDVVRLSLPAAVPTSPEPGKKMLLLALAPLLALLFGAGAAVLARKRDHRIHSGRDLEDLLGFPPMAVLPARADVSARVLEEYVLRLAAGLEGAYRNNGAQTFLLTAVSASTDIRPLRKALTAQLERIGLDVAVARTTDLMTAAPEGAMDLGHELARAGDAAGEGFVSLHLAQLKAAHALVVIDAPSLGISAETEYVARCADATVLIADCGVTTREDLLSAIKLLERLHAKGLGMVLQEMHLRYGDTSFRHAIDAFERRQADRGILNDQSTVYPLKRHTEAAPAVVEAVVEPVVAASVEPEVQQMADVAPVEVVAAAEPEAEEELVPPTVFRHRGIRGVSAITEVKPMTRSSNSKRHHVEFAMSSRKVSSREKMAPTLSALREQVVDGETPMSGSKNWFQRLMHRDESKVSIIPDDEDGDKRVNSEDFLSSRISRSVQAPYLPPHQEEVAVPAAEAAVSGPVLVEPVVASEESAESSYSRRFMREDLHPYESAAAEVEHAFEDHDPRAIEHAAPEPVAQAANEPMDHYDSVSRFTVPEDLMAPWQSRKPEPFATEPYIAYPAAEPAPDPSSKVRPVRPLSFHELAGAIAEEPALAAIDEPVMAEVIAERADPVEEPAPAPADAIHEEYAEATEPPQQAWEEPLEVREPVAEV